MDNCVIDLLKDTINEQKKTNRRLFVLVLVLIAILLFTNISWLIYEAQFTLNNENAELYAEDSGLNVYGNENNIGRGDS